MTKFYKALVWKPLTELNKKEKNLFSDVRISPKADTVFSSRVLVDLYHNSAHCDGSSRNQIYA